MKLRKTIRSTFRNAHVYGEAGEEVKLIAKHGNVAIVENQLKQRFPVPVKEIIEDDSTETIPEEKIIINQVPGRKSKISKPAPKIQTALFQ